MAIALEARADERVLMKGFVEFESLFGDDVFALFSSDLFVEVANFLLEGLGSLVNLFRHC